MISYSTLPQVTIRKSVPKLFSTKFHVSIVIVDELDSKYKSIEKKEQLYYCDIVERQHRCDGFINLKEMLLKKLLKK